MVCPAAWVTKHNLCACACVTRRYPPPPPPPPLMLRSISSLLQTPQAHPCLPYCDLQGAGCCHHPTPALPGPCSRACTA